jgi:c-di-GMP-binding flagellar brake protein YcgR
MIKYMVEKRRYTRIIFNERNKVRALVSLIDESDPEKIIPSSVLNMSQGGIQISIERKKFQDVNQGDTLILRQIQGIDELAPLVDISMYTMWIMDNEYLEHVLLGMSFGDLSDTQHQGLRSFVENRLSQTKSDAMIR